MAPAPSSESDSSSGRSTSPEPDNKQKQATKAADESEGDEGSSSSSGSESENESDSSSEEAEPTQPAKKYGLFVELFPPVKETDMCAYFSVAVSTPQPYNAPFGFKPAKKQTPPSSKTSSVLSNLRGKQVFHITAPSFLPMSKVKEVSMAKILQGEPILTHDGVNYGIPVESISENGNGEGKALLVYDESTQTYHSTTDHIPTYHVQEMIDLPGATKASDTAISALRDEVKPPRPQPKHLKMRFKPVGGLDARPETIGSSSESESEGPSFKVPPGEREERKRKHHHTDGDAANVVSLPRKKSKKHSPQENADEKSHKKSKKSKEEKKRKKTEKA